MPNDFSTDPRCKAVWRFENNLNDSQGGNHLTGVGSITFPSDDKREGDYSANFEIDNGDYAYRSDADLDEGFPLKAGDTNKKITVCLWLKPESYRYPAYVFAKYDTNNRRSFAIQRYGGTIRILTGYNNGQNYELFETTFTNNGEWVHVGVSLDGIGKKLLVRIYRLNKATAYSYSFDLENEINVKDADLTIGARHDGNYQYDGLLDEVVVFNDTLSFLEIDAIRAGNYSGPLPQILAESLGIQAVYDPKPLIQGEALGLSVAYSLTPEATFVQADALGLTIAYDPKKPPKRTFPVPHPRTRWQTHPGRRKFPILH